MRARKIRQVSAGFEGTESSPSPWLHLLSRCNTRWRYGRLPLLLLREAAPRGAQAHLRPARLHLRRVRRAVQRHHRQGRGGGAPEVPAPARDRRRARTSTSSARTAPRRRSSVAVYNHYKRIGQRGKAGEVEIQKGNILLLGPTGCGKTLLVQTLAQEARRAVRHRRRHHADRGRLRRRGRRERHQGALPQRRRRSARRPRAASSASTRSTRSRARAAARR